VGYAIEYQKRAVAAALDADGQVAGKHGGLLCALP
jgi:hypothetical protein